MVKIKNNKLDIIEEIKLHENDKGSVQIQIASLSHEINVLTQHLSVFKKDKHSKTGLIKKVNRRKKLLKYIKKNSIKKYLLLIEKLGIRK